MLVLERTDQARARGRRAYAEIIGAHYWAVESPPHGWPSDSTGIAAEIAAALRLFPDAADAIFSGATGRQQRDALELSAYARACSGTRPPWVTSIKGATGDFGAAGALTIAAAALAIAGQIVPPLCRLDVPPEATGVRLAGQEAAPADLHHVLVSGLAHGGQGLAIGLRQPSA
jgi:3-oxoacyl-(acyl-carrier-protein) synthase